MDIHSRLKIPYQKLKEASNVSILALLSVDSDTDDLPIFRYIVEVCLDGVLIESILVYEGGDGGVVSERSNEIRRKRMQLTIDLSNYISGCASDYFPHLVIIKELQVQSEVQNLNIPKDFVTKTI